MAKKTSVLDWIYVLIYSIFMLIWNLLKLPFVIIERLVELFTKIEKTSEKAIVERRRSKMSAEYQKIKIIDNEKGSLENWEKQILSNSSKVGIIVGARGTGKTALGMKILENVYAKTKRKCYALGFNAESLPDWIQVVENTQEITNGAFVLIDEGGILFSSRRAMTNANKFLSDLLLISRHKNLSILFIAQNSSNLDVNIIRQADYLLLKPSSLLQKEFERKIIRDLYEKSEKNFKKHEQVKGLVYIYADNFKGFASNDLPSFWSKEVSTSFKDRR